ncbi:MAG: molybdenum cofactor biosynthesis protein MoaE [Candidatus Hydrothermarchaeales archaeon]
MNPVILQSEDFSTEAVVNEIKSLSKRIGGIVIFLGTVRDFSKGKDVDKLVYEHYSEMALKELKKLREDAIEKFDLIELRIIHRYGELEAGQNVVLIVAAAQHRANAFEACQWCIKELKMRVPIWKKEFTSDGEVWVEEHP